jgi:hypothetical protein
VKDNDDMKLEDWSHISYSKTESTVGHLNYQQGEEDPKFPKNWLNTRRAFLEQHPDYLTEDWNKHRFVNGNNKIS